MNLARSLTVGLCAALFSQAASADDAIATLPVEERHPAWLIELPSSIENVMIADTANAAMLRFGREGDALVEKDRRYMSIGLNGTGKVRAWDRKTPLGVYFITDILDTSKLHDKYGVAAYPLDYPNAWDRHLDRTGSGIWLHGVDHRNPERPPRDTDGCLSLPNEAFAELIGVLEPLVTPVIVARELAWADPGEIAATRLAFRMALEVWRESLSSGDLRTYLSLYSDEFRYRDMDKASWSSWRLGTFEAGQVTEVEIDDVLLLADPEESGLYLSRFTQVLMTDGGPVTTTKRLYWRRDGEDRWEIIAEDSG